MQILFTLGKSRSQSLLPQFIYGRVPTKFFDQQPKMEEIEVLDYQSAFSSFSNMLNLSRVSVSALTKQFGTLSYGYEPMYSIYHKDYPLGIADGIDFKQISEFANPSFEGQEREYYDAVYSRGGEIIFLTGVQSEQEMQACALLAGPGSSVSIEVDDYDIDYCTRFRCQEYKESPFIQHS